MKNYNNKSKFPKNNFKRNPIRNRRIRRNIRRKRFYKPKINNNKQKQKDKYQNKKINQLEQKMKNLTISGGHNLFKSYLNKLNDYITALVNPERFINSGIKIPNPLTTYSFSYGFKEQFTIGTTNSGSFTLIWYPNIFSCNNYNINNVASYGGTTCNVNNNLVTFNGIRRYAYNIHNSDHPNIWFLPGCHIMNIPTEGYRLVSASLIIRYVGAAINKSGYILTAPTYRNYGTWGSTADQNNLVSIQTNKITDYTETLINNTRGSTSKYILNENYVKRLYVPLDSFDTAFEDPGYYYSITTSQQGFEKFDSWELAKATGRYIQTEEGTIVRYLEPEEGNPLKYVFFGKGFEANAPGIINVIAYYNFECIPVEGQVVPNNNNNPGNNEYDLPNDIQRKVFEEVKKKIEVEPENFKSKQLAKKILSNK